MDFPTSKENISNLSFSDQKTLYARELEKRRQEIKLDEEVRHFFSTKSTQKVNSESIAVLDLWFLKVCDDNPEVKRYLSFYYDCIKEGRYDKIAERIIKNRKNYERVCLDYFQNEELLRGKGGFSVLYSELSNIVPYTYEKEWKNENSWQEFQSSISQVLFQTRFHANILVLGLIMEKSHPFIGESWMSNEFGVLGDDEEVPGLVRGFESLKSGQGYAPLDTRRTLGSNWEIKLGDSTFESLGEVSDSMTAEEYLYYLTRLSRLVADTFVDLYDVTLELLLYDLIRIDSKSVVRPPHAKPYYLDEACSLHNERISHEHSFEMNNEEDPEELSDSSSRTRKDEMVVFINTYDYEQIFTLKGKHKQFFFPLYCKVMDYKKQGSKIHKHNSVPQGHMVTFKRGTYSFVHLSSSFDKHDLGCYLNNQTSYRNFTFCARSSVTGRFEEPYYSNISQEQKSI